MPLFNIEKERKEILKILRLRPRNKKGSLLNVVKGIKADARIFLKMAREHQTPFFAVDGRALERNIEGFLGAFRKHLPEVHAFYAMKANHHPMIVGTAVKHGMGLDVSSGRELGIALKAGAKRILFSGPGKTPPEHELALENSNRVIVNLDSFGELERLGKLAAARGRKIRAGVRINVASLGGWTKFGIPLDELKRFWDTAKKYPFIGLQGIQFHISWNRDVTRYEEMLGIIGGYLEKNLTAKDLGEIRFIDFGGGYFPDRSEGYYPWTAHYPGAWPGGKIVSIADSYLGRTTRFRDRYYITESSPVAVFARGIAASISRHLKPLLDCEYFTEPGRIIANDAMHIVIKLIDCKKPDFVISDGGVNMVGWEYGEFFYYPLVNLTHPSDREIPCTVTGPLCTPHDTWGYNCYAEKMVEGDIIVVPNQGAYKYVLAQDFIKPKPQVYLMP
jgi:diaminopimelate decarboxylase